MKLLVQLTEMERFTPNEQSIAAYILRRREQVLRMSIRELAGATYTSHSAVNRLTRKLGLAGFREFMLGLAAEFQQDARLSASVDPNYPFGSGAAPLRIAEEMAELIKDTVDRTAALLDDRTLADTAAMLDRAGRIFIYAIGDSQIRARSFQNKLIKINKYAILANELSEWAYHTLNLTPDDCVVFLTYHGRSTVYPKVVRHLLSERIPFVSITSARSGTLARLSPLLIRVPGDEEKYAKIGSFSSQIAFEYVLNVLYSCVYNLSYTQNKNSAIKALQHAYIREEMQGE